MNLFCRVITGLIIFLMLYANQKITFSTLKGELKLLREAHRLLLLHIIQSAHKDISLKRKVYP